MTTDYYSKWVIVSQRLLKKNGAEGIYFSVQGFKQTMTYDDAFAAGRREPSTVYDVHLNDYIGALNQAAIEHGR